MERSDTSRKRPQSTSHTPEASQSSMEGTQCQLWASPDPQHRTRRRMLHVPAPLLPPALQQGNARHAQSLLLLLLFYYSYSSNVIVGLSLASNLVCQLRTAPGTNPKSESKPSPRASSSAAWDLPRMHLFDMYISTW